MGEGVKIYIRLYTYKICAIKSMIINFGVFISLKTGMFMENFFERNWRFSKSMMKKQIYFFLCFSLFIFKSQGYAQKDTLDFSGKSEQDILDEAEFSFSDGNYIRAVPFFQKLLENHPNDVFYKYKLGICYIYKSDEKEKSIKYLDEVYQSAPKTKDLLFYLGLAYHLNYKFDDATKYFKDYLLTNPPVSKKVLVNKYIENCKSGKVLTQTKFKSDIKNIGPVINTRYSEYVPVISSDVSILIFTYRGPRSKGGLMDDRLRPAADGSYYEDIFISQKVGNEWLSPESIGDNINTKGNDACIALSADGQKLFIFKSTPKDQGDIYMSMLDGEVWSTPERLGPTVNTKYWEGSVSMSSDEQTLFFASERPGGLGKRDIWMVHKLDNGEWGEAINMGPNVNTPLDEDAPFIHTDGITLFFSSEGHNSLGGYDIMYSTLENDGWSSPINLDYPVNTIEDDRFYVLSADGERGYFSSDRKGGHGQQDIYIVSPGIQGDKPVLALVVGVASGNNKPVDAMINVYNAETGKKIGSYRANSSTGKYVLALSPGIKYKISIEHEGMEPHVEYVNTKSLNNYVKAKEDFKLYSKEYKMQHNIKEDSSSNSLQANISVQLQDLKQTDKAAAGQIYESQVYQTVLKKYGDVMQDGVEYKIELGKYEDPADFTPVKIAEMGKIESVENEDGTVFSMGPFKTLLEAEIFKYKLLSKDSSFSKTATITVIVQGRRVLIPTYFSSEYTQMSHIPIEQKAIKSRYNLSPEPQDTSEYQQIYKDHATQQIEGLSYKLELGSFKDTTKFNSTRFNKFGKIESEKYPDGYTRYTTGPFKTLAEAEAYRKMLTETDAAANSFVTVSYFEKRKSVIEQFRKPVPSPSPVAPADTVAVKTEPVDQKTAPVIEKYEPAPGKLPANPCEPDPTLNFSAFIGKDLNDTAIYNKLMRLGGRMCVQGLTYKVQIGAYRHPENFKYSNLTEFGSAETKAYPDGIARFTMKEFKTLAEAEAFRKKVIKKGTIDAWITAVYNGERRLLPDLISVNFYNRPVN